MEDAVLPITQLWEHGVEVRLDRPRRLSLNLLACRQAEVELERLHGQPPGAIQLLQRFQQQTQLRFGPMTLGALVWCGLRQHDPEVTLDQTLAMLDHRRAKELFDQVNAAWTTALQHVGPPPPPPTIAAYFNAVPLLLDRWRWLQCTFGVQCAVEREAEVLTGVPFESVDFLMDVLNQKDDALRLQLLLFHMLRGDDPQLTMEHAARLLPLARLQEVYDAINLAYARSLPPIEDAVPAVVEEKASDDPPADAGAPSGAAPDSFSA